MVRAESSTGCEVMRPAGLHAQDRAHASDPIGKRRCANVKMNERGKTAKAVERAHKGALSRDSVSGRRRVKVASLPAPLRFAPLRG